MALTNLLLILAAFLISALPLYFSVQLLGGKAGLFKVVLINLLVAFVAILVRFFFDSWGGLVAFIVMIWIYKDFFELSWLRALLAWLLQFVFAVIIIVLAVLLFGVAL
ncbi:hypothetical protein JXA12_00470 [Candidatus Woesearchaeota archaeon]|nr:hypothetical protein [Candidatus Woesearchaeota archaeon]